MEKPELLGERLYSEAAVDSEVPFYPETWNRWLGGLAGLAVIHGQGRVSTSRRLMCESVDSLGRERPADALVSVFQWGFGTGGRGASRARRVLTGGEHDPGRERQLDENVINRLRGSLDPIRSGDPQFAYDYFRNRRTAIKGLGLAFSTRWMYAVSARGDWRSPAALPILDELVQTWPARETKGLVTLRYGSSSDYARYVPVLDGVAQLGSGLVRVDIEAAIFALERDRRRAAATRSKRAGA